MKRGDPDFMSQALAEARKASGRTRPNPMVGCVIVKNGHIVAVGHHRRAGGPHAEIEALRRAGSAAAGADVYVTLEPCNHYGRTGPCTEALLAAKVKRIFVATSDPNPLVDGRGIRRLRRAGVEVSLGLLGKACRELNAPYESYIRRQKPWVVVKLAESLDGRVATHTGESRWISSPASRRLSHKLRNTLDAILVGRKTICSDDPSLTCRIRGGRDPVRIVLDTRALTPVSSQVVKVTRVSKAPTWIMVGPRASAKNRKALERAGAITHTCQLKAGLIDLDCVLRHLYSNELMSLLVEGGPQVLGSFFDAGLVDEMYTFLAPLVIGGQKAHSSVAGRGAARLLAAAKLNQAETRQVGPDILVRGFVTFKK